MNTCSRGSRRLQVCVVAVAHDSACTRLDSVRLEPPPSARPPYSSLSIGSGAGTARIMSRRSTPANCSANREVKQSGLLVMDMRFDYMAFAACQLRNDDESIQKSNVSRGSPEKILRRAKKMSCSKFSSHNASWPIRTMCDDLKSYRPRAVRIMSVARVISSSDRGLSRDCREGLLIPLAHRVCRIAQKYIKRIRE